MKVSSIILLILISFLIIQGYPLAKKDDLMPGVYLYKQTNYRGVYYHLNWDDSHIPTSHWVSYEEGYHCFDNKISSIKLVDVPLIAVYSEPDFKGNCETITGNVPNLDKTSIGNNTISSVKMNSSCYPAGKIVELFQNENFKGRSVQVSGDVPDLGASNFRNATSSFKLSGVDSVVFFNHPYYEGKCETFNRSMPSLKGTAIGNNALASLKLNSKCDEYYTLTVKNHSAMLIDTFFPGGSPKYWYGGDTGQRGDRDIPAGQSSVFYMTPNKNVALRIRAFYLLPDLNSIDWKTICTFNLDISKNITIIAKGTMITKMWCEKE